MVVIILGVTRESRKVIDWQYWDVVVVGIRSTFVWTQEINVGFD